ncbi:MAG: alpha/beta hydrolase [Rhodoferax sp.]|nr:alpha/beta hydrolase [Rhodoferax sp.]
MKLPLPLGMLHPMPTVSRLTPALPAKRIDLDSPAGPLSLYSDRPEGTGVGLPPLLLVHSVNAAASAAEIAPLFAHYRQQRAVYALELPGFGFSDRSERPYTPRLMTDALHAALTAIQAEQGGAAVDVLAVSLAGEFAARAKCEAPHSIRRLALVSPTGFRGAKLRYGLAGSTLGLPWLYRLLTWSGWRQGIFNTLTRPGVVRYFLRRTWGGQAIDEALWRYCVLTARQPGASNAPFYFVSAFLFSADINTLYEALDCPVWVSMATRGDFTDYQSRYTVSGRANWQFQAIEGGALPYFEDLPGFASRLDPFWI